MNKDLLSKIQAAALKDGQPQDTITADTRDVNGKLIVDMTISRSWPPTGGTKRLPIGYISAILDPADKDDADAEFSLGDFRSCV